MDDKKTARKSVDKQDLNDSIHELPTDFWRTFFVTVFGIENIDPYVIRDPNFKDLLKGVDVYIPSAKTVIEYKNRNYNFDAVHRMPNLIEQAVSLTDKHILLTMVRYIIISTIDTFRIYDLTDPDPQNNYNEIDLKSYTAIKEMRDSQDPLDHISNDIKQTDDLSEKLRIIRKKYWSSRKTDKFITPEAFAWHHIRGTIRNWIDNSGIAKKQVVSTLIKNALIMNNRAYGICKCLDPNNDMSQIKVPDRCELFRLAVAMELDKDSRRMFISVMDPDILFPYYSTEVVWESYLEDMIKANENNSVKKTIYDLNISLSKIGAEYMICDQDKADKITENGYSKESNIRNKADNKAYKRMLEK